jgi:membrane protein YqaA with SNARE-associated domain
MGKEHWLKKNLVPILTLLLVIAITAGIFYLYRSYPEWFEAEALKKWGYLGAFLVSLLLNATIFFPTGGFLVLAALGAVLPSATLVGLAGGAGAAIGELTGYMAGYSGQTVVSRQKVYTRVKGWVEKWGFLTIFLSSIVPFVFDLIGIAAGALRVPLWKFLLACWLGRTILYVAIALAGAWGWKVVLPYLG